MRTGCLKEAMEFAEARGNAGETEVDEVFGTLHFALSRALPRIKELEAQLAQADKYSAELRKKLGIN